LTSSVRTLATLTIALWSGLACSHEPAKPNEKLPVTPSPLHVSLTRTAAGVDWQVSNTGEAALWAYLLVPSIVGGRWSFEVDSAWSTAEGDTLVLQKVEPVIPEDMDAEPVRSGAVRIDPGQQQTGSLALNSPTRTLDAYRGRGTPASYSQVVLEVGYVADKEGIRPQNDGTTDFAWIWPQSVPGGQQLVRSAAVDW